MNPSIALPILETNQIGDARRRISDLAVVLDFTEERRSDLAIVVSELANNLVKHADGGGILIARILDSGTNRGVEVISVDSGRGMIDSNQCMQDGFTTAGSSGTGLGAVKRLSTVFDIYSIPEKGTIVLSQIWCESPKPEAVESGAICLPIRGEQISGDTWALIHRADTVTAVIADGLGHGPDAAKASQEAARIAGANPDSTPLEMINIIHVALKGSRGAAVAVARIHFPSNTVDYCAVGNTVGEVQTSAGHKRMFSHNGTAGVQTRRVQQFRYPWDERGVLILHSDGISTQWALEKYPGLFNRHAAVIGAILYRDFKRGTDDLAVVVLKQNARYRSADA